MKKLSIASLFLLTLTFSCGDFSSEPDWSKYEYGLKSRIDNSNCNELQKEFNNAADNSDIQRARTGEGNSLLMGYIDEKLRAKGCY